MDSFCGSPRLAAVPETTPREVKHRGAHSQACCQLSTAFSQQGMLASCAQGSGEMPREMPPMPSSGVKVGSLGIQLTQTTTQLEL